MRRLDYVKQRAAVRAESEQSVVAVASDISIGIIVGVIVLMFTLIMVANPETGD